MTNFILRGIGEANTVRLVEEFKKHECLWNTSLPNYPCYTEREQAVEDIANTLKIRGFHSRHVRMKLKNLRNSYAQELKRIDTTTEAFVRGKIRGLYKPRMPWFPIMDSFLRPHLQSRTPAMAKLKVLFANEPQKPACEPQEQFDWQVAERDNASENSNNDVSNSDSCPEVKIEQISVGSEEETLYIKEEPLEDNDLRDKPPDQSDPLFHQETVPCKNQNEELCKTTKHAGTSFNKSVLDNQNHNESQDCFARYIASLLKRLPPQKALDIQPKIINLIIANLKND